MKENNTRQKQVLLSLLVLVSSILLWAIFSLPLEYGGPQQLVSAKLNQSGVTHPVTAVLLNFRGYDTLLEIGVLLLILMSVWSLGYTEPEKAQVTNNNLVLIEMTRVLIPILIMVAGYLLWVGAFAPGGAFHAGAVLGAAGVLLTLCGKTPLATLYRAAQWSFVIGLVIFATVGIGTLLTKGVFLQYPVGSAKYLILLIEATATISIGTTLTALYIGAKPANWRDSKNNENRR